MAHGLIPRHAAARILYPKWARVIGGMIWLLGCVGSVDRAAAQLPEPEEQDTIPIRSGASTGLSNVRPLRGMADMRFWLQNMVWYHGYSVDEIRLATGMGEEQIRQALQRFRISEETRPEREPDEPLLVMPYPGGRHPRLGFLEGAINPQRETKLSVFVPWAPLDYVVLDVPEALWSNLGLTYLAHTHLPTIWSKEPYPLRTLEWKRRRDGGFAVERILPNGIKLSTEAIPTKDALLLEMKLTNGTTNLLSDLRVQACLLLKGAKEFNQQTNRNKIFAAPFTACRSSENNRRWIVYGWTPCHRTWANPPCPCMHADPKFPDCSPGETRVLRGWLSFYEGDDLEGELRRIESKPWLKLQSSTAEEGRDVNSNGGR